MTNKRTSDHDLLVRVEERLINLTNLFTEHASESKARLDYLAKTKADKSEIGDLKTIMVTSLDFKPDHEERIRKLERFAYLGLGGVIVMQLIFDVVLLLRTLWK